MLLGATRYADDKLPDLPAVRKTVDDLAAALTDSRYGVVPQEHCTTLVDEGDLRLLGRRLRSSIKEADDLLLVYYAGHGLVGGKRHELYLALPDSDWAEPEFNSLEYDKLRHAVLDSPAAVKLVILDCCFSGRVISDSMADPETGILGQIEVAGTYVLTSAQRDQVALVLPGEKHTAFTGRLLRLLREGIVNGPELLSIDELYRRLLATMRAENLSVPQKRGTKTADLIAIAYNRAFAASAGPALRRRQVEAVEKGEAGDWAEAAALLDEIHAEQARILGPDHEDALRTRQFLAHCLGGAGDPQEAAARLRKLLPEQLHSLGVDHEDTLRTRQFLAVKLGEAGYRDEAVALLRILLPDRRRVLGADHVDTLRTSHMLARNLARTGSGDEAVALLREVLQVRERILGLDHPHTRRASSDLAALLGNVAMQ